VRVKAIPNAAWYNVFFQPNSNLRFSPTLSNNTIHSLCDEVAEETEGDEASSNGPKPVEILNVLTGNKTKAG
jgi:hypothetical protein